MKKTVTREIEVDVCDSCGHEAGMAHICFTCGYTSCWSCTDKVMVKFNHGVYVSGWADGYYCKPCDMKLSETKDDPLHNAYVEIRRLSDEIERWNADFTARHRAAQAETERLYGVFREGRI